jgi:hypothetical protein
MQACGADKMLCTGLFGDIENAPKKFDVHIKETRSCSRERRCSKWRDEQ